MLAIIGCFYHELIGCNVGGRQAMSNLDVPRKVKSTHAAKYSQTFNNNCTNNTPSGHPRQRYTISSPALKSISRSDPTWDEKWVVPTPRRKKNPPRPAPVHHNNTDTQREKQKEMDSRGIEPRTTPMLREYYTTKPRARIVMQSVNGLHM
jgi:hypothetical protein